MKRYLDGILNDFYKDCYVEYDMYIKCHLSICEREDLIGYSGHILSIVEK